MRIVIWVLIAAILIVAAIPVGLMAQFSYLTVWGNNADFKSYKTEFVLVKNYVEESIPQGKQLVISKKADHFYDLYDCETKQYLNCPENIRTALQTISEKASRSVEVSFNQLDYVGNRIVFGVEAVGYAVVYSPDGAPYDALGERNIERTHCKKILKGWYHVVIY
ncbi:MAG: hypothetical protein IJ030_04005 [Oscillospiraceae bacterium]|nr:hypothetical protein [Oscillospiraceae bacterium]